MSIAVLTVIRDLTPYFDVWRSWYEKQSVDIYYLCFNSDLDLPNSFHKKCSIFDIDTSCKHLNNTKDSLLEDYECVIYADIDEILYYPGGFDLLLSFLKKHNKDYATCNGFDIFQTLNETSLNFSKPLLLQRSKWSYSIAQCKPLVLRKPLELGPGNHGLYHPSWTGVPTPNLFMLHLRKADKDIARDLNQKNIKTGEYPKGGAQHQFYTGEKFEQWWTIPEKELSLIPEWIKTEVCI